jgi:hypothetical protein
MVRSYQRSDLLEQRRLLMEQRAAFLTRPCGGHTARCVTEVRLDQCISICDTLR